MYALIESASFNDERRQGAGMMHSLCWIIRELRTLILVLLHRALELEQHLIPKAESLFPALHFVPRLLRRVFVVTEIKNQYRLGHMYFVTAMGAAVKRRAPALRGLVLLSSRQL